MKEEALSLARAAVGPAQKLNILREYVQAMTLRSFHESEAFAHLAFVGGTALRFVYKLQRFSEDLDFSLHRADGYVPRKWLKKVKRDLTLMGFDASVSFKDSATVHKGWIRVAGIMHETGLAPMRNQKLSIKIEIDTRPPPGAETQRTVVSRHGILAIQHYTLSSLMAGKIHALLTRAYPKGRDWYDLVWYRGLRPPPEPNLVLLQNACDQSLGRGQCEAACWKETLKTALAGMDVRSLREDVYPFLERQDEARLLDLENLAAILRE